MYGHYQEQSKDKNNEVQHVILIWLDNTIDKNSAGYKKSFSQLRQAINRVYAFTNDEECVRFLKTTIHNSKVCMIISDSLARYFLQRIHSMTNVERIFICQKNGNHDAQWKTWSKVQGVYTSVDSIANSLTKKARMHEQNTLRFTIVPTTGGISQEKINKLDPSFMYTMVLKEIIVGIDFNRQHIKEFANECRRLFAKDDEPQKLLDVDKIEKEYLNYSPVWWYSHESFLYSLVNKTLREMNVNMMIKLGFFIGDLHRHLIRLHQEQYPRNKKHHEISKLYRGISVSTKQLIAFQQNKGGLVAFNDFLSTSERHEVSMNFAKPNSSESDSVGILFVLTVDPSQSTTPFASIAHLSDYPNEKEVLFSMHSIFRIHNVIPMTEHQNTYQVELSLTSDTDKDIQQLTNLLRKQYAAESHSGWAQMAFILKEMGEYKQAEQIYKILLEQETHDETRHIIYHDLGTTKQAQGQYQSALGYYTKSLKFFKKRLPENHPRFADFYNNIGTVHCELHNYQQALAYFQKALEISEKKSPLDYLEIAGYHYNIGIIYGDMENHSRSLSYLQKALHIRQQNLPPTHPDLANTFDSIGEAYSDLHDHSRALEHFQKALTIRQSSLPDKHHAIATSYEHIGMVYLSMKNYSQALKYLEHALAIQQSSSSVNPVDLAGTYNNIGIIYVDMRNFPKALSYYQKALAIQQRMLPANHPDLFRSHANIRSVYIAMRQYGLIY